jgi:conjugative transfer region protein TrbK
MDLKIAARMIAVLAIGAGMIAAVAALREGGSEDNAPARRLRDPGGEPVLAPLGNAELVRCRDLGMAAADDTACKKAWAEHRRRFFETPEPRRPEDPSPERFGTAPAPAVAPSTDPATEANTDGPLSVPSNDAETQDDEASRP